jgi:hypothetical protein
MIKRFAALASGTDEYLHLLAHRRLAYVISQSLRPDSAVHRLILGIILGSH